MCLSITLYISKNIFLLCCCYTYIFLFCFQTKKQKDPTGKQRHEDAVIDWTWKTFIENPTDPTILLRLPMTKASVRAMVVNNLHISPFFKFFLTCISGFLLQ